MALRTRGDAMPYDTGIDPHLSDARLQGRRELLSSVTGCNVQPNKAIVGRQRLRP
jgi:isopropylmalate/homocitrate/citramalate synthase